MPTLTFSPHNTRGAQQSKMMAYQRGGQTGRFGDFAHRGWSSAALDQDPKATWVAQKAKDFREFVKLFHLSII